MRAFNQGAFVLLEQRIETSILDHLIQALLHAPRQPFPLLAAGRRLSRQ
jgi:hypothetical protein